MCLAAHEIVLDQHYEIKHVKSGKYLSLFKTSTYNCSLEDFQEGDNRQWWKLVPDRYDANLIRFLNANHQRVMDAPEKADDVYATPGDGENKYQLWFFRPSEGGNNLLHIIHNIGGRYLDGNGKDVYTHDHSWGNEYQYWCIEHV